MGFFSRGDQADDGEPESLRRIEQGGIPAGAERRLRQLGAEGSLFTSGLSVPEFALLGRLGPRPLAQVMGASVVRTGWQYLPALDPVRLGLGTYSRAPGHSGRSVGPSATGVAIQNRYGEPGWRQVRRYRWRTTVVCELDGLSDAWKLARRRALDRLTEEAVQVGADAVVGVHLHRGEHDFGKRTIECVVTGTAIGLPGSGASPWPVLTDLSVQDYWRLHSNGYDPAGLLATTAVVFASAARSTRLRRTRTTRRSQELEELSRAFNTARETVRGRLLGQVGDAHGEGAVGVALSHAIQRETFPLASSVTSQALRGWQRGRLGIPYFIPGGAGAEREGWMITMHGAGTAVRRRSADATPPTVKTAVRLGGAP